MDLDSGPEREELRNHSLHDKNGVSHHEITGRNFQKALSSRVA